MKTKVYLLAMVLLSAFQVFSDDTVSLRIDAGIAEIRVPSLRDWQYTVEYSEDLENWIPIEKEIFGTGSDIICTNSLGEIPRRFYRTTRSSEFNISFEDKTFQVGNQWLYDVTETFDGDVSSYQQLERVDRISLKNGYTVAELAIYSNSMHWVGTDYVLHETNGIFSVGYRSPVDGDVFYSEPNPFSINHFTPGARSGPYTLPAPEPGFGTLSVVSTVYIDYSTVTVSAGSFAVTICYHETATGSYLGYTFVIESKSWYAKNIGEVMYTSTTTFDDPKIGQVGYETRTLRSYFIP